MFVALLNDDQQAVLGGAVHSVAAVDGEVHGLEVELLDALARDAGSPIAVDAELPPADLEALKGVAAEAFAGEDATSPAARAFIAELAGLVTIGGAETNEELKILSELMEAVGVDAAEMESFLEFGRRAASLASEGTSLVLGA